jgi:methionyl-tRNA synthetase
MAEKYFNGTVTSKGDENAEQDAPLLALKEETVTKTYALMDEFKFAAALSKIWELITACNKYIETTTPWNLAKAGTPLDGSSQALHSRLERVMFNLLEGIRTINNLIAPCLPETSEKIASQIGWNGKDTYKTHKGEALFPRVDIEKELEELQA